MKQSDLLAIMAIARIPLGMYREVDLHQQKQFRNGKSAHCFNTGVRSAQRAAKKLRNVRARSSK